MKLRAVGRLRRRANPTPAFGASWPTIAVIGVAGLAVYKLAPRLLGKECGCHDQEPAPTAQPARSASGL